MKKILLLIPFLLLFSFVSACVTPYDDLEINESTTLCGGVYNIVDTNGDGVIRIVSSDVVLDFNNTVLIGDNSGSGLRVEGGLSNITILGPDIRNYEVGIWIDGSSVTVRDANISGITDTPISFPNSANVEIYDSKVSSSGSCLRNWNQPVSNLYIENITCENSRGIEIGGSSTNTNITIKDSVITDSTTDFWVGISFSNVDSGVIENVQVNGNAIELWDSSNILIKNIDYQTDIDDFRMLYVVRSENITVMDSVAQHTGSSNNWCIRAEESVNLIIDNVTISNFWWSIVLDRVNESSVINSNITVGNRGIYTMNYARDIVIRNNTVKAGETAIRVEACDDCLVEDNYAHDGMFGIWTCCPGSNGLTIRNNKFDNFYYGVGIGQSTENVIIEGNEITNSKYYGIMLYGSCYSGYCSSNNITVRNNTVTNSKYVSINLYNVTNVQIYNNTLDTADYIIGFYQHVENVTACDNTLNNYNYTHRILKKEDVDTVLKRVMRIDSDSCTPYLDLILPTSIDFGTVKVSETKSINVTARVVTNMLGLNFNITSPDLPLSKFNMVFVKNSFSNLLVSCYDASWGAIDCADLGYRPALSSYIVSLPSYFEDASWSLNNVYTAMITLIPSGLSAGHYEGNLIFTVSSNPSDTEQLTISFDVEAIPTGGGLGGGGGALPTYATVRFITTPSTVNIVVYDFNGNVIMQRSITSGDVLRLPPGKYRIVASAEGYETLETWITATESHEIQLTLTPIVRQTFSYKLQLFVLALIAIGILIFWHRK